MWLPAHAIGSAGVAIPFRAAAVVDPVGDLRLGDLPRIAVAQPLVGDFHLPSVAKLLVEDAELVADAVANSRNPQRGQRIQVASGQAAEAAVAQTRLLLACQQDIEVLPERAHRLARRLLEIEIEEVVAQMRAEQEFRRKIAGDLTVLIEAGQRGAGPTLLHPITDSQRQRAVIVVGARGRGQPPDGVAEMVGHCLRQGRRLHAGADLATR